MTDTKIIRKAEVIEALERLVERHGPDTLYIDRDPEYKKNYEANEIASCRNVDDTGACLCIVGTVLVEEFGVDGKWILDHGVAWSGSWTLLDRLRSAFTPLRFDDEAGDALGLAQNCQDNGSSWGSALAAVKAL